MKKENTKRPVERRKKPRSQSQSNRASKQLKDHCFHCSKKLEGMEKVLFVEEEVGRMFCTEACITDFFMPEIERLEKEYYKRLPADDLSGSEREMLAHLRWITLQEPDEIWREKTLSGDYRFTLISEFKPDDRKIWCICICLFLRGEPSFLYLAFSSRRTDMVHSYRKGERLQLVKQESTLNPSKAETHLEESDSIGFIDGLASDWTEDELLRAKRCQERSQEDIPTNEFSLYQSCLEETLDAPDEVWSHIEKQAKHKIPHRPDLNYLEMPRKGSENLKLYHFIRYYPDEDPSVWYIIVARETDNAEQIEILDAFPTRDAELVSRYRNGNQEVGSSEANLMVSRVVH